MGILSNLIKNWRLMRLMKRIGAPCSTSDISALVVSQVPSDTDAAERELLDLVCNDPDTRAILHHHGATRSDIEEYYRRLSAMGLGRWVGGSYVSAASIALKPTLLYLLAANKSPLPYGWSDKDLWLKITSDLINYFRSGTIGSVSS